mgnify:CR=1 FL=1
MWILVLIGQNKIIRIPLFKGLISNYIFYNLHSVNLISYVINLALSNFYRSDSVALSACKAKLICAPIAPNAIRDLGSLSLVKTSSFLFKVSKIF